MVVGGQNHAPAVLASRKRHGNQYRMLGGIQGRYGRVRKQSPPPLFDLQKVQFAVTCYTSYSILAHSSVKYKVQLWKFRVFSYPRNSLHFWNPKFHYHIQTPANSPCPEPDQSSPNLPISMLEDLYYYYTPIYADFFQVVPFSSDPSANSYGSTRCAKLQGLRDWSSTVSQLGAFYSSKIFYGSTSYEPPSRTLPTLAETIPAYLVLVLVKRHDLRGQQFPHLLIARGAYDRHCLPAKVHAIEELLHLILGSADWVRGNDTIYRQAQHLFHMHRIVHTGILQQ